MTETTEIHQSTIFDRLAQDKSNSANKASNERGHKQNYFGRLFLCCHVIAVEKWIKWYFSSMCVFNTYSNDNVIKRPKKRMGTKNTHLVLKLRHGSWVVWALPYYRVSISLLNAYYFIPFSILVVLCPQIPNSLVRGMLSTSHGAVST